jgi:hypothetical protein
VTVPLKLHRKKKFKPGFKAGDNSFWNSEGYFQTWPCLLNVGGAEADPEAVPEGGQAALIPRNIGEPAPLRAGGNYCWIEDALLHVKAQEGEAELLASLRICCVICRRKYRSLELAAAVVTDAGTGMLEVLDMFADTSSAA